MDNNTIDSHLLFAQNAIANAINQPLLRPYLDEYGYTEAKLKLGEDLYKKSSDAQQRQKKEYGEQFEATFELEEAKTRADKIYMKYLKVARIALGNDPGPVNALQLLGRRACSFSGWINQAKAFYANAIRDPRVMETLAEYNITKAKLVRGQELLLECKVKYNTKLKEKGEAQTATRQRDEAFDALDEWIYDFVAIARIALEENPQYLEILGIVEPS
jgi:hypothetical protein